MVILGLPDRWYPPDKYAMFLHICFLGHRSCHPHHCITLPSRRSRSPSESSSKEEGSGTVEVEVQPPYPFNQSLLSGDDSDEDEQGEATDLPATPWHPKPLGVRAR